MIFVKTLIIIIGTYFSFGYCELSSKSDSNSITNFEKNANEFKFEGASLGITIQKFIQKFPEAKTIEDDEEKYGSKTYQVESLKSASLVLYRFLDGILYFIAVVYDKDKIDEIGGFETLTNRVIAKIGRADRGNTGEELSDQENSVEYTWSFNNNKSFELILKKDGTAFFKIIDDKSIIRVKRLKAANAEVGF